jgi:hypothetical protein
VLDGIAHQQGKAENSHLVRTVHHWRKQGEQCGVALLKIIIRETSHLDTNATTNQIQTKLSSLDTYITTIDGDISHFNQYAKLLIQSLTARNQTTSDLLINLFTAMGLLLANEVFKAWLLRKQDDHEERRRDHSR